MPKHADIAIVVHESDGDRLWEKISRFGRRAGRVVVERALRLYYAAQDPATPPWAKRAIYSGLAYFVMPFDLIPDFIPVVGYTDDAATLLLTLFVVSAYVSRDVKVRARARVDQWFGPR